MTQRFTLPLRHKTPLFAAFLVLALWVVAPGIGLVSVIGSGATAQSFALSTTQIHAIGETLLLLGGVAILTASMGVVSAWLVSLHAFPLKRILDVALLLPLAFPTYLAAFVAVDLLDFFGPVQSLWRMVIGAKTAQDYRFFDVRSLSGAILVLALVLYPYVYAPCRIVFMHSGRTMIDAARLLGASGWPLFFRVGLPIAKPAIFAGMVLTLLETLNDIGASEHLGVSSLSVVIRDLWLNRGDLPGAARMAAFLMGIVAILLALSPSSSGSARNVARASATPRPIHLTGWRAKAAMLACAMPVLLGFIIPAVFLISRAILYAGTQTIDPDFFRAAATSLGLALSVSLLVMGLGAILAIAMRIAPSLRLTRLLPTLGYALPGTVLVMAILPVLRIIDDGFFALGAPILLSGSMLAVLYALSIRFLGIGAGQGSLALSRLPLNVDAVARVHGFRNVQLAIRVHLPVMMPGLMLAGALVFIDTIKELPATLLLRPLNIETLATRAYAQASAGMFERAAFDSLAILAMSSMAALLLARRK